MGRFARSYERAKAQAGLETPRSEIKSWKLKRSEPRHRMRSGDRARNRSALRVLRLISLVAWLIIGASSGWMTGSIFVGPSYSDPLRPAAAALPPASGGAEDGAAAGINNAGKTAETSNMTDKVTETNKGEAPSVERANPGNRAQSANWQQGSRSVYQGNAAHAPRRYSRGGNFQPTAIMTKPAKVISKPFKKINPLKLF